MSVNGVGSTSPGYENKGTTKVRANKSTGYENSKEAVGNAAAHASENATEHAAEHAAVYEKNEETVAKNKTYKRDDATIERLIAEAEKRTQQLRDLVQKMLMKQGQKLDESTDIYSLLREGKLEVDEETRAQAQKDIAEDGYWGVEQTSERMVSFAKALTGGDPSKANKMIDAVKKGFEEATKAWGGELPGICKDTMDAAIKKLETWRDETDETAGMSKNVSKSFQSQAVATRKVE